MRPLASGELDRLHDTQEGGMFDTCTLLVYQAGMADRYNQTKPVYNAGASLPCGLDETAHKEVMDGTQVAITDARLRLPVWAVISSRDRVRITHRLGQVLSQQPVYALIGEARRGPSGLLCNLRLVVE